MVIPLRSFLKIHLSTVCILIILTNLFSWINVGSDLKNEGWPLPHGLFTSYYVHRWKIHIAVNGFVCLSMLLVCWIVLEYFIYRKWNQPPFTLKGIMIRSSILSIASALICMLLSLVLIKNYRPSGWTEYFDYSNSNHRVIRSILTALPLAGMLGAGIGYFAYREVHGLKKFQYYKTHILPALWYVSVASFGLQRITTLPILIIFLPIYFSYCRKRNSILIQGTAPKYFIGIAFIFTISSFLMFHKVGGLRSFHDKIAMCAYLSMWMADATIVAMISYFRNNKWIVKPDSELFQFSLSSLIAVTLILSAYVSLLMTLFGNY